MRAVLKMILFANMDAMACSMDCQEKLKLMRHLADLAEKDIEKSLHHNGSSNQKIEENIKIKRSA